MRTLLTTLQSLFIPLLLCLTALVDVKGQSSDAAQGACERHMAACMALWHLPGGGVS